jgi:hypothetical protein
VERINMKAHPFGRILRVSVVIFLFLLVLSVGGDDSPTTRPVALVSSSRTVAVRSANSPSSTLVGKRAPPTSRPHVRQPGTALTRLRYATHTIFNTSITYLVTPTQRPSRIPTIRPSTELLANSTAANQTGQ